MFFIILLFITAIAMEGIGSYISVVGLNSIFAGDWVIIAMAVIMDIAKIVSVSFLYNSWKDIKSWMATYMTVAVVTLMTITSVGAYGYLSNAFQKAVQPNKEVAMKIELTSTEKKQLLEEKMMLVDRRKQIETQIANLPNDSVAGRTRLIRSFREDTRGIQTRLVTIDARLAELNKAELELKGSKLEQDTHIGPVVFVSEAFGITMEEAVKWVILIIILVFDPLAVMLIMAGNFLLQQRKSPPKRDIYEEVKEGFDSLKEQREEEPFIPEPRQLDEPVDLITNEAELKEIADEEIIPVQVEEPLPTPPVPPPSMAPIVEQTIPDHLKVMEHVQPHPSYARTDAADHRPNDPVRSIYDVK